MDLSIIVPLFNEAESIPELFRWISKVMAENRFSYELIFILFAQLNFEFDLYL